MDGNCLVTNVVYSATVETLDVLDEAVGEQSYTGLAENWKKRFYQHRSSFNHRDGRQTSLSNHIWKLNESETLLEYRAVTPTPPEFMSVYALPSGYSPLPHSKDEQERPIPLAQT